MGGRRAGLVVCFALVSCWRIAWMLTPLSLLMS